MSQPQKTLKVIVSPSESRRHLMAVWGVDFGVKEFKSASLATPSYPQGWRHVTLCVVGKIK